MKTLTRVAAAIGITILQIVAVVVMFGLIIWAFHNFVAFIAVASVFFLLFLLGCLVAENYRTIKRNYG